MKRVLLAVSTLLVCVALGFSVAEKEQLKANGEILLLALAPVDPRSLMQGDYMQLRYTVADAVTNSGLVSSAPNTKSIPKHGSIVIAPDAMQVAQFVRVQRDEPLAAHEKLLHFTSRYGRAEIRPDSFFFQEGHATFYQTAKYGVFKFDSKGNYLLVGLADAGRQIIVPPP